jgi:hypothetical protein
MEGKWRFVRLGLGALGVAGWGGVGWGPGGVGSGASPEKRILRFRKKVFRETSTDRDRRCRTVACFRRTSVGDVIPLFSSSLTAGKSKLERLPLKFFKPMGITSVLVSPGLGPTLRTQSNKVLQSE